MSGALADALRQDQFDASDATFLRVEPADAEVQRRVQHGDVAWYPMAEAEEHFAAAAVAP